ncbi:MAG: hypothetical protein O2797_07490 [Bacteroidetes bacterium]|nr:hypothetical protein [Bacteroidota bacterium]MDA1334047.1 hypothetical protein [Bacteroidota bacterium]
MLQLLTSIFLALLLIVNGDTSPAALSDDEAPRHDFHVTYSRMAVENDMAVVRIRLFKDDLSEALSKRLDRDVIVDISPESDSLFQVYFNESVSLVVGEETLAGNLVGSGEEYVGKEPMWWYLLEFKADGPIEGFTISQKILSEMFPEQKNIVQVQHFPSEKTYSLYCVEDSWEYEVSFTD